MWKPSNRIWHVSREASSNMTTCSGNRALKISLITYQLSITRLAEGGKISFNNFSFLSESTHEQLCVTDNLFTEPTRTRMRQREFGWESSQLNIDSPMSLIGYRVELELLNTFKSSLRPRCSFQFHFLISNVFSLLLVSQMSSSLRVGRFRKNQNLNLICNYVSTFKKIIKFIWVREWE